MLKLGINWKILLGLVLFLGSATLVEAADEVSAEMFAINNTWMLCSTFLVFVMHLGFATLEAGLTRSKNTVNILFKNTVIVAIGVLTYALMGFNLMYPGADAAGGWFGFAGFGIATDAAGLTSAYNVGYTYWTDFIFQAMFAATAATIVSGAVAERVKLSSFLIFSALYVALVYPVVGMWKWGGGWLDAMGFYDFAGSTLVHSVGGWAALVCVLILGPRFGKFSNGKVKPIMGHNMPLAAIGVFMLWLGWFGFNGGSVLSADPGVVSFVFVTTTLAAAAGIIGAMLTSWIVQKKPDLSMVLNGCLAGLVGITAGADVVSINSSLIIGLVAGILVVFAVLFFDRVRIDDPVGALSVHLACGIWGTLAVGIFSAAHSFVTQLIGVIAVGIFCSVGAFLIFGALKLTMGVRVAPAEEQKGLDISEHGMEAYSGFQIFISQ
ncbi:MAG: ammonium transporter [Deltaproteobacteria bacterium]|nr:ammonium transporter [Deltaproteobacteria bacterium]